MMSVVLDDRDTVSLAAPLKSALRAVKSAEGARDVAPSDAELSRHGHGGKRIQHVVPPRNGQVHVPQLDRAAAGLARADRARGSESLRLHAQRGDVGRLVEAV